MNRPMWEPPTTWTIAAPWFKAALLAAITVFGVVLVWSWITHLEQIPPVERRPVRPCFATIDDALAVGDTEDAVCSAWYRNGELVIGPLWMKMPGDVETTLP